MVYFDVVKAATLSEKETVHLIMPIVNTVSVDQYGEIDPANVRSCHSILTLKTFLDITNGRRLLHVVQKGTDDYNVAAYTCDIEHLTHGDTQN